MVFGCCDLALGLSSSLMMPRRVPRRFSSSLVLEALPLRGADAVLRAAVACRGAAASAAALLSATGAEVGGGSVSSGFERADVPSPASTIIAAPSLAEAAGAAGWPLGALSGVNEYSPGSPEVLSPANFQTSRTRSATPKPAMSSHHVRRLFAVRRVGGCGDTAVCRPSMSARIRPELGAWPLACSPPERRLGRLIPPLFKCIQPLV